MEIKSCLQADVWVSGCCSGNDAVIFTTSHYNGGSIYPKWLYIWPQMHQEQCVDQYFAEVMFKFIMYNLVIHWYTYKTAESQRLAVFKTFLKSLIYNTVFAEWNTLT